MGVKEWIKRLAARRKSSPGDQVVLPEERRFEIGDQVVIVRPLTLAEIKAVSGELGQILQRLATEAPQIDIEHFEQHLNTLVPLLAGALEEFLGKLLGVEPAYLMQHLTPLKLLQLIRAILEVNQLPLLRAEIPRIAELLKTAPIL
jgi:hypothetical protein